MNSNQKQCDTNATVMGSPECILRDRYKMSFSSIAVTMVRNLPHAPQSLEDAIKEVTAINSSVEGEDTFDSLADKPLLKEQPALSIQSIRFVSWTTSNGTLREQILKISTVVEDAKVPLFGDTG